MKITFEQPDSAKIGNQRIEKHMEDNRHREVQKTGAYFTPNGADARENWIADLGMPREKAKNLIELQQEAAVTDVAVMQDYRTLLSHTMSEEDYARMEEEGFHFSQMDPETVVTIVDKIKAELARSGQYIAGYTDDLDMDTLAAALGSDTLASSVCESFREADIPLTQENLDGVKMAWEMASDLRTPTEGSYRYMVSNEMEPEIWDFYLAQNSGAASASGADGQRFAGQPRFYSEDVEGYYAQSANREMSAQLQEEIEKLLTREGLMINDENLSLAGKLLSAGLPLTGENMARWETLENVTFPVTEDEFAKAAASAIVSGREPIHGNLAKNVNIYDKAVMLTEFFGEDANQRVPAEDIVSRRQLEEVRLRMTAEVNVKLLRSGFAIDTAPMEELLEALRKAEAEVAQNYFPGDTEAVPKYELYQATNKVVGELPGLPAQILGSFSVGDRLDTLSAFHADGKVLQETFEKAQESYETLMTAPRRDLGDSIRKAFANVDDILRDLQQELSEENRRAVRILGYNRMNIDAENIERVKSADMQVQSVIRKMTPASVLRMIRDGVNPLEKNFSELEQYFDLLPSEYESEAESYSRFLYGLEQNREITQQERDAYIGIYRMLHQIDASDGAVVGALVNTGAEIHFSNLLSAVRSGKFKSMDVSVTEDFGATMDVIRKGESISDQIAKGFVENVKQMLTEVSYSEEAERTYRSQELEQLRQAASVNAESVELLSRGELPPSADNLLAAQELLKQDVNPFDLKSWKGKRNPKVEELLERMTGKEAFSEGCQDITEETEREVQRVCFEQADSSMDVRSLKLLHKQLSVATNLAEHEDYIFPMYIGDDLAKVHFTLDQNGEEKGKIDIAVDLPGGEHLECHLLAENGKVTGYLVGNTEAAVMKLQKAADIFSDSVQEGTEGDWEVEKLPVTDRQRTAGLHHRTSSVNREVPDGKETYKEVDNTELYRIAKVFLKAVQK